MFRFLSLLLIVVLGSVSIVGSGGGDDITGGGVTLTRIDIAPSVVPKELLPDMDQQFIAIGTYSNGSQEVLSSGVSWNSSAPGVASINTSGLATGITAGTADITAFMSNITSSAVTLTVATPSLLSIQVSPPSMSNGLPVGAKQQFVALGVFDNNQVYDISDTVTWNSSNTAIISFVSGSIAMGQGAGSATINASTVSPAVMSNTVDIAVSVQSADALIVEPLEDVPLPINRTRQFKALLLYANNTTFDVTDEVTWSSNDTAVATVINNSSNGSLGLVTGVSVGRVTITANHGSGNSADGVLDVTSSTIQSVVIEPATPGAIPAEHTQSFITKGTFSDSVERVLTAPNWFIDNSSIATFNNRGTTAQVLGVAAGTANLVYLDTTADGLLSGQTATAPLTVTDAVLDTIAISPTTATIADDTQLDFTAIGNFDDGSNRDITQDVWWETGSNLVAGFSAIPGELTALSSGGNVSTTAQAKLVNSQNTLKSSSPATVNVEAVTLTGLTIVPPASPVTVWETEPYTVEATFSNASTADYTERVTWSMSFSNPVIAVVSTANGTKGQVTAVRSGSATLNVIDPQTGITQFLVINIP